MIRRLLTLASLSWLLLTFSSALATTHTPLPSHQAFQLSSELKDAQTLVLTWKMAPSYYLYKDRFYFKLAKPDSASIAPPLMPPGEWRDNPELGHYAVYTDSVRMTVPILRAKTPTFNLQVHYQGCSDHGYCYPPTTEVLALNLTQLTAVTMPTLNPSAHLTTGSDVTSPSTSPGRWTALSSDSSISERLLSSASWPVIILSFLSLGLLIAFTPCVLPMIPVLSALILGGHTTAKPRAFRLSLVYVLAMALTYAVAGVIFAYLGSTLSASLQKPWIIITFSLFFVAMALSLFGLYTLQLPQALRTRVAALSQQQTRGSYWGVMIMGILSTLILSPCVTPPLVGVLGYISHSGDKVLGFLALFSVGIGMGIPLLIIGLFGRQLLPKAGHWMVTVNQVLGILLLAVAVDLLTRIVTPSIGLLLWSILALGVAIYLGALQTAQQRRQYLTKAVGIVLLIYGIVAAVSALQGESDWRQPWLRLVTQTQPLANNQLTWLPVKTLDQVMAILQKKDNRPILLDFYADWCVACKEMDRTVLQDPRVIKALASYTLLRADVTANDSSDQALQQYFQVIAPPTYLFFDSQHNETPPSRLVGAVSVETWLRHMHRVTALNP